MFVLVLKNPEIIKTWILHQQQQQQQQHYHHHNNINNSGTMLVCAHEKHLELFVIANFIRNKNKNCLLLQTHFIAENYYFIPLAFNFKKVSEIVFTFWSLIVEEI